MNTHLKNVGAAASRHDRAGATREIDAFAADVAQQQAAGHLSKADYAALETGIGQARARIGVEVVAAPAAPVVTTPPVSVAPAAPVTPTAAQSLPGPGKSNGNGDGGKPGKGHGGGNGKGDGGGD